MIVKVDGKIIDRCPYCGSTDIHISINSNQIWCNAFDADGYPSCDWQMDLDDKILFVMG